MGRQGWIIKEVVESGETIVIVGLYFFFFQSSKQQQHMIENLSHFRVYLSGGMASSALVCRGQILEFRLMIKYSHNMCGEFSYYITEKENAKRENE